MKKISIDGLTGNIKFDEDGKRSEFVLDIIGLTDEGLQKIGNWDSTKGLNIWNETFENDEEHLTVIENDDDTIYGKQLTVLISLNQNQPYAKLKEGSEKLEGNDKYEGFVVELIRELSQMVGFNYTFKIQADKSYGSKNWLSGEWNGMMKEVIEKRVDLALGDLTITSSRESAVDFTDPFLNIGISILYRKPEATINPNPLYFLLPFSEELWFYIIGAFAVTTLCLFMIGRITPGEWINPHPCVKKPDYLENQFDFCNSWWFTLGTMFQQGSNIVPKTLPTRIVASVWWFFVLMMITFYIAQLAALFIVYTPFMKMPISKINSIEDLANLDGEVPFGAIKSGTTYKFFGTSDNPYYRKIYQWMEQHPEYMIFTNTEGVERVKQEDFAFLMESAAIDYVVERECNLMKVGGLLDNKGYGIAMAQGSPYRVPLNDAILKLQQSGKLSHMIHKWWKEDNRGFCSSNTIESLSTEQLTMEVVWGLFVVLLLGCLAAFLIGLLLMCFDTAKRAYSLNLPFYDLLKNDIKLFASRANLKIGKVKQNPTDVVLRVPQNMPMSSAPQLLSATRSPNNRMQPNQPSISVTKPSPQRRY
jgi:ABC-type amino acid transport substrate-binding protein